MLLYDAVSVCVVVFVCVCKCVLCGIRCARSYVFLVRVVVVLVIACAVIFVLNTCLCVVCQSV